MEHIDHDYLSTQVIQIPSKSKISIPAVCLLSKMSYREVARERTQFLMTHRSADQRYCSQPAGVDRADEEIRHDSPLRLHAEPMGQGETR